MSDTHLNTSSEPTTPTQQNTKKKNWIVAALGLVLVILGSFSVFQTDTINNLAIEIGTKTMTKEMVEAYPEHAKIWEMASEVLDRSIEARATSPDALATLISTEINKAMGHETPEIKEILERIIDHINSIWATSPSEEFYVEKLKAFSSGIKKAL